MVELERFTDATDASYEVTAPVVTAVGVGRQQGTVVVRLEDGLQGEMIRRVGLLQVDQNDLSPALRQQQWNFAYRYGAVPFELQLRVEKVKPRISVAELIDAEFTTSQLLLNWQAVYTIEDAGVFQLRVDLPDGFEVRSVQGKVIGDAQPAAIDAHHRIANDSPTWLVNLSKKAIGKVGVTIQLSKRLDDPNLLAPTGEISTIPVPLPHVTESDVEFSRGAAIVVSAPESLRINPGQLTGSTQRVIHRSLRNHSGRSQFQSSAACAGLCLQQGRDGIVRLPPNVVDRWSRSISCCRARLRQGSSSIRQSSSTT